MIDNKNIESTEDLIHSVINYAKSNNIKKVAIFAKKIENVLKLHKEAKEADIEVLVISFPTNQLFYIKNDKDEIEEKYPEILSEENRNILHEKNIKLLSSTLPLESIIIPGERSNPYNIISETLNLFGEGLDMIVQASMMLTDNGYLKPSEQIISMNGRTAVDLNTCNSRFLFHPNLGIKINQIIK